jgi:hypothetical protein
MADGSRFELERAGDATVVRVIMPAVEAGYDEIREGWLSFVMQLRFALERHPGEERRTIQRSGSGAPPDTAGDQFYRNQHQVGLVVDGDGSGLVILHSRPDGGWMAIVTTYGLDDDAFADLERRWRERY